MEGIHVSFDDVFLPPLVLTRQHRKQQKKTVLVMIFLGNTRHLSETIAKYWCYILVEFLPVRTALVVFKAPMILLEFAVSRKCL